MKFGSAKANETAAESGGGGNGKYIRSFRDQETNLRFLDELDTWYAYWEHFDQGKSRSFPCTRDRNTCPGCTSENERTASAAKRYLVNAIREFKGKEYVDLFKVPVSLMEAINRRNDQDGSITARNYTIVKMGKGTDTKYMLEWDDKSRIDFDKYAADKQDFEEALMNAYVEVWGPPDLAEPAKPAVQVARVEEKPKAKSESPFEADPPSEPKAATEQDAAEDDEDEVISEDALRKMGSEQLVELYGRCGIEVPREGMAPKELADYLIEKLG